MEINVTMASNDEVVRFSELSIDMVFTNGSDDTVFMKKVNNEYALMLSTLELCKCSSSLNVTIVDRVPQVNIEVGNVRVGELKDGDFFRLLTGTIIYRKLPHCIMNMVSLETDNMPHTQRVERVDVTNININLK